MVERAKELGPWGAIHDSATHQLWHPGQASAPLSALVVRGRGAQTWTPTGALQLKWISEAGQM